MDYNSMRRHAKALPDHAARGKTGRLTYTIFNNTQGGDSIMAPKKKIAQTVITEGKFYTISAANGKVVEVADYNIDNGAKIQLWDNANAEWQQWNFVAAGDGVYRIQNRFTAKMLDLDMGGVSDGTRVHQWEGAQASSQLWVVEPTNDGRVKIKSNLAGKLL